MPFWNSGGILQSSDFYFLPVIPSTGWSVQNPSDVLFQLNFNIFLLGYIVVLLCLSGNRDAITLLLKIIP